MDLDAPRLFLKGLRWSYRRYGVKGGLGFLLLCGLGYVVYERNLKALVPEEETAHDGG